MKKIIKNSQTNVGTAEVRERGNSHSRLGLLRLLCLISLFCYGLATQAATLEKSNYDYNNMGIVYDLYNDNTAIVVGGTKTGKLTIFEDVPYNNQTYKITKIADNAFSGKTGITSVEIGDEVITIGANAFKGCTGITEVSYYRHTGKLKTIGEGAFRGCTSLQKVLLADGVTTIGNYAFYMCTSLGTNNNSFIANGNLTTIGDYAFYGCTNLGLFYGNGSTTMVRNIGNYAFCGCKNLYFDDKFNNTFANIGEHAFENCTSLGVMEFPISNKVENIGNYAFKGCTNLQTFYLPTSNYGTVPTFGEGVFYGCTKLKSVTLSGKTTSIPVYAFLECSALTSISIPTSVTTIGGGAFFECSALSSVSFGNNPSITLIDDGAFCNCTSLTQLTIGDNATMYASAVDGCTSLTKFIVSSSSVNYSVDNNGVLYNKNKTKLVRIPPAKSSYTIPNTVQTIGQDAFGNCTNLTSLTIPSNVKTIETYGISGSGITSITIPTTVTKMGYNAVHVGEIYCNMTSDMQPSGWNSSWYWGTVYWNQVVTVVPNNTNYGSVTGGGTYSYGSSVRLTATPKTGYMFVRWDDDGENNKSATRTIYATETKTYTAIFMPEISVVTQNNYQMLGLTSDHIGYYIISNVNQLKGFAELVNGGTTDANAVLTADIVVNQNVLKADGSLNSGTFTSWDPIGTTTYFYSGTFDGNGHYISGLYFKDERNGYYPNGGNRVGLFGNAKNATFKNISVIDSYFSGHQYVGGICGYVTGSNSQIVGCYNAATIYADLNANSGAGGICGAMDYLSTSSKIENCHNAGYVSGNMRYIGGICGIHSNGIITKCYNTGKVYSKGDNDTSSDANTGGIVGFMKNNASINNCYNTGNIETYGKNAGGIIGYINSSTNSVTNCYNTGSVTASSGAGSIYGYKNSSATSSGHYYLSNTSNGSARTADEFASGAVALLLNGGTNEGPWFQTVGVDASPVLDESHGRVGMLATEGNTTTASGDVVLLEDYTVEAGKTLVIPANASVSALTTRALINNGRIVCNGNISGFNFSGSGSFVFENLTESDITFNTTSYTYKGSAYTLESGLDVTVGRTMCGKTFTYDGSTTVTYSNNTNAGEANAATATWNGTISKQFTITPKEVTLEWSNTSLTYNGSAQAPSATATGLIEGDECSVTVSGAQTNAGSNYTATASALSNANYTLPATATTAFSIAAKEVGLEWSNTAFTYNGSAQAPTATATGLVGNDECNVIVSGAQTNFGSYTATAERLSNVNYKLPNNKTKAFTIDQKVVTLEWGTASFTYNGSEQVPTATATGLVDGDVCNVTVSGAQIDADTYTATASTLSNNNYKLPENKTKAFTINPKEVSLVWSNTTFTYNGLAQVPTATAAGLEEGDVCNVTVSGAKINADTYTATAERLSNGNYKLPEAKTTSFTIDPKEVSLVWGETSFTYNGSAQAPTATATGLEEGDECNVTVEGAQINHGNNYTATATGLSNANYKLPTAVTTTFSIGQATPGYTMPDNQEILCNQTLTDITLPAGFAFADVNTILAIGENTVGIIFTPEDAENYKVVDDIEITVTVNHSEVTDPAVPATCTATGLTEGSHCSVCEQELVAQEVVPMIKHTAVTDAAVPATCTATGLTEGSHCSVCDHVIVAQEVVPMAEHTESEAVKENEVAATCTENGSYNTVVYCSVCHAELSRETVTVTAPGHTAGAAVAENPKAATCTAAGSVDSVVYCTVCNAEISRKTVEIPVIAHTVVVDEAVAATTTETGLTEGSHCSVCHQVLVAQQVIPVIESQGGNVNQGEENQGNENQGEENLNGEENQGEENQGEENQGNENQGEENQGEENQGEENQGEENQGEENQGEENQGEENQGEENQGEENQGEENQGEDNQGEENQGEDNQGEENQGEENQGNENQGEENQGNENQGNENQGNENQGEENLNGEENQGEENQGNENQGNENQGEENQGEENQGEENQGEENQGEENQGEENQGEENQGEENQGGNESQGEENQGNENTEPATSVEDEAVAAVNIFAYGNTIVVEADEALTDNIFVFDAMGRMVAKELATSTRTELTMQQGIYIVRIGNKTQRVVLY